MVQESHANPEMGIIPVPYGPQANENDPERFREDDELEQQAFRQPNQMESDQFRELLCPADIYTQDGTYWADLPMVKRMKFNYGVEKKEAGRELSIIGQMFKKDPLSPVGWYWRNCILPGAGLLLEGYVLFSVGNIKSLFADVWPECWGEDHTACNETWVQAVSYLSIIGITCGQILVGFVGDLIGRRFGLIQDAVVMFVGLLMLTAMWGRDLNGWVICYAWSLFFYGIGVGGEYPMTATSGMEITRFTRFEKEQDRLHRGRRVVSAFSMQGWGQLLNQAILIVCILMFHSGSAKAPFSQSSVQWTFRVSFAVPAVGTLLLVYFRAYKMPSISPEAERTRKNKHITGYDAASLKLAMRHFGGRLLATTMSWFFNDVLFYGNKIFQGNFMSVIVKSNPESEVIMKWLYNMINIGCSIAGYYLATVTIDTRFYGRNWMMQLGFAMDFILFMVPAFNFEYYTSEAHISEFQTMYFLSSFFHQFGANCVTFLVAGEVYPTSVRATAHGISAAVGKLGAVLATVLYNYIDDQQKFHFAPWFGLAGMVVTFFFLPDVTGLDLHEQDRRWKYMSEGRDNEYHGVAIHPMHLSLWERFRGVHKNYNPEADYKQRMEELRGEWEERQLKKYQNEDEAGLFEDNESVSPAIHDYFVETSPKMSPAFKYVKTPSGSESSEDLKLPDAAEKSSH